MRTLLSRALYATAVLIVAAIVVMMLTRAVEDATVKVVKIGTGSLSGVYFPTGGAIAKLVNRKAEQYGFRCFAEATDGSMDNLNGILSGQLDFGIIQGDAEYQAVHGEGEWYVKGPQTTLRAICGLHEEMITLIATVDSGITSLEDLVGKRVNIGAEASGQRANAIEILTAAGISWETDLTPGSRGVDEAAEALERGEIDAFFHTVGHPNELVEDTTEGPVEVRIVPIPSTGVVGSLPYLHPSSIPAGLYPALSDQRDVPTVGLTAALVTTETVDERIVYAITMNLFENLDEFKSLHPAFTLMSRPKMLKGFAAPLHPGAVRYYRQSGVMKMLTNSLDALP